MRIGVVGCGVVGSAIAKAYSLLVDEVRRYDLVKERATHSLNQTLDTDLVFVCLPTPRDNERPMKCDLSIVDNFFENTDYDVSTSFVLKSTVPIGTTKRLTDDHGFTSIVHSPEFLTARTAEKDALNPKRSIIGCPRNIWNKAATRLHLIYKNFKDVPVQVVSSDESEAIKLFQNGFSAVKISFFNEIKCLADKLDMNWEYIRTGMLSGGWINPMHTMVPGPDGKDGWGGMCLEKDLANLIDCLWGNGCVDWMSRAAYARNEVDRGKNST